MFQVIAAVSAGAVLLAVGALLVRRGGSGAAGASALNDRHPGLVELANPLQAREKRGKNAEKSALERSKLVIHALLQSVTESVGSLLDESAEYGNSLEQHKVSVKKAMTVAGIRELEKVILEELAQMQTSNATYRVQLDDANAKLAAQQVELERLQSDTSTDFLTKIPNRRSFEKRYQEEWSRARRYGNTFSLVFIDVDHFKAVNDKNGHLAGDRVLRAVAQLFEEQKRASDFFARYGGEEFVFILPETSAEHAKVLAEKSRRRIEETTFRYESASIRITVSAGVGELNVETDTTDSLFTRVDAALYRAKDQGRNRVEMAEPA